MALNHARLAAKAASNAALSVALSKSRALATLVNTGSMIASNTNLGKVISVGAGVSNVHITPLTFGVGDFFMVFNNTDSQITITQNTGVTLYLPNIANTQGAAATGNRNVAARGYVTITTVAANTFVIHGTGVS